MYLTNSVGKFIDEVMRTTDTDFILSLLYWELIELDYYVTIYSLNRSVHDPWDQSSLRGYKLCGYQMECILAISDGEGSVCTAITGFVRFFLIKKQGRIR